MGLYVEFAMGIAPCLLCLLQRAVWLMLWICLFLLAVLHWPSWFRYVIETTASLATLLGVFFAGRQVWLQMQAASSEHHMTCLPSAYFLIENTSVQQFMHMALSGTDDCALVHWTLAGISMAWWSLMAFVLFFCFIVSRALFRCFF